VSREIEVDAPAPLNDVNVINVINGVVKIGAIERGAKPTKETSAARNYGFALQIMQPPDNRTLNLRKCRYTRDMLAWIEEKLGDSTTGMPAVTVYKNFMGLNGPGGVAYGLSKRLVQLYLLCLVREGKLLITLSGRAVPVDALDYANIATVDFRAAVLDAFDQIQCLKPPEGWAVLAPFAAVLLEDPALRQIQQDADIQQAVQRLLAYRDDQLGAIQELRKGLAQLFVDLGLDDPLAQHLQAWENFLTSPVETANALPYLRNALDEAFAYHAYREDHVRTDEVDDLAARKAEVLQATAFYAHRERLRAVAHYTAWARGQFPENAPVPRESSDVIAVLHRSRARMSEIRVCVENETRLVSEVLAPTEAAIETYTTRYLQAFDRVTQHTAQAREAIAALSVTPAYLALGHLARVPQLGADLCPGVDDALDAALTGPPELFPAELTRAAVQQALPSWPQPPQCPLRLAETDVWFTLADDALASAEATLEGALMQKVRLLHSDALRERLAQGHEAPFIAALLEAQDPKGVAAVLVVYLGLPALDEPDPVALLARALRKLQVRKVRLSDFAPAKRTLERGDVDAVVAAFRAFLLDALETGDDDTLPVIELEV